MGDKVKIYEAIRLKLFLALLVLFTWIAVIAFGQEPVSVEFYTLPKGLIVDTRIPETTVAVILRHFEAIENGDLSAFRSTLIAQDGVDLNHHMRLIVRYFGCIIGIDMATFDLAMAGLVDMSSMHRRIFYDTYPLKSRGTGFVVKKIEIIERWHFTRVVLENNENEELMYYLLVGLCPHEENFISAHHVSRWD